MEREALKLALETLKWANKEINEWMDDAQGLEQEIMLAITALKAALAQPAQEPVAIALNTGTKQGVKWLKNVEHGESLYTTPPAAQPAYGEPFGYFKAEPFGWTDCAETDEGAKALYEAPPKREWVGMTDNELADIWYKESLDWMEFARAHEAALKEKNT